VDPFPALRTSPVGAGADSVPAALSTVAALRVCRIRSLSRMGDKDHMGVSLRPKHLGRYRDLARLLVKYGRSDLVKGMDLESSLSAEDQPADPAVAADASQLAEDLEKLGATYIKLGQLLSTRADLMPPAYMEALARLQDDVEPFAYAEVEAIIEAELGGRVSRLFTRLDPEPLAAASLGQVHRAWLRDGRPVAVKVQRPDIRERIQHDLEALRELAALADQHTSLGQRLPVVDLIDDFRRTLMRELDYEREAANLRMFRQNLGEFEHIIIPLPIDDYSTGRVLTMEYVPGRKVTEISPLRVMELDGRALGEELLRAYFKQILSDGVFHADPHPGNVFLTFDDRIALIDLGMVGYVTSGMRERLLKLLLAVAEGRGEDAGKFLLEMSDRVEGFEERPFTHAIAQLVSLHENATARQVQIGRVLLEMMRISGDHGVRQPASFGLLGKTLLNLDQVSLIFDRDFDVNDAIQRNVSEIMRRRMLDQANPARMLSSMIELNEFVQRLPSRLNRVLDRVAENDVSLKIDAFDENALLAGFQKIANRITLGLVLAALIVGAAMIMRVETSATIMGYPALAVVLFLAAAVGGMLLVYQILRHDRKES
jgi:predicted unusual protein kinase regulating ubiquinone biosynthesis (AarF/ABC1/UbiB family)